MPSGQCITASEYLLIQVTTTPGRGRARAPRVLLVCSVRGGTRSSHLNRERLTQRLVNESEVVNYLQGLREDSRLMEVLEGSFCREGRGSLDVEDGAAAQGRAICGGRRGRPERAGSRLTGPPRWPLLAPYPQHWLLH